MYIYIFLNFNEKSLKYTDICEKIDIIEVAMRERMDVRTQAVFCCLYEKCIPWSKVRDEFGNVLLAVQVNRAREKSIRAIAKELLARDILEEAKWEDQEKK